MHHTKRTYYRKKWGAGFSLGTHLPLHLPFPRTGVSQQSVSMLWPVLQPSDRIWPGIGWNAGQQHWQVISPCPLQQGNALPGTGQEAALPRMSEGVLSMRLDISQASLCHLIAFVAYT